jgi:hypothetical protein
MALALPSSKKSAAINACSATLAPPSAPAVAAGQNFSQVEIGDANPTHQDCRTCHQIHTTYTGADWALETDAPVVMVTSGATFDGGSGNLCANCHQARRYLAGFAAKDRPWHQVCRELPASTPTTASRLMF